MQGLEHHGDPDPRAALIVKKVLAADLSEADQKTVLAIAQAAYEKFVLLPTKSSWRKDNKEDPDWSRKMLEREVERTSMREIAFYIKKELDAQLGTLWHVAYGRSFAAYVTCERMSFLHFTIEGAEVVAWRHGK